LSAKETPEYSVLVLNIVRVNWLVTVLEAAVQLM